MTCVGICPRRVPSLRTGSTRMRRPKRSLGTSSTGCFLAALAGERAGGAAGRVRPRRLHHVDHREEMRQIHDEIWPILEC